MIGRRGNRSTVRAYGCESLVKVAQDGERRFGSRPMDVEAFGLRSIASPQDELGRQHRQHRRGRFLGVAHHAPRRGGRREQDQREKGAGAPIEGTVRPPPHAAW